MFCPDTAVPCAPPPATSSCKYKLWRLSVPDILAFISILLFLEHWKITGTKRLAEN